MPARAAVLVGLADACHLLPKLFAGEERALAAAAAAHAAGRDAILTAVLAEIRDAEGIG
jgi:hypothetical protein